jgi:hypothetical protein
LWARREDRVLITEDKDFGQLVFASGQPSGSVILIRFPAGTRTALPPAVLEIVDRLAEQLSGTFTVDPARPGTGRTGSRSSTLAPTGPAKGVSRLLSPCVTNHARNLRCRADRPRRSMRYTPRGRGWS